MIRRITLENYMSHRQTVIEPAAGLTVLIGPNNCGKSAVVAALRTLAHNERGDYMVRHGCDDCSVTVETDDGHTIEWRRRKGTVSYTIDGEALHRLGGEVAETLQERLGVALRLPKVAVTDNRSDDIDIHFAEQKSPLFLIDKPPGRAASFFASSSDASKLMVMQKRHRLNVSETRRAETQLAAELDTVEAILQTLAPVDEVETKVAQVEREHDRLRDAATKTAHLEQAINTLSQRTVRARWMACIHAALKPLDEPPALDDTVPLAQLCARIGSLERVRARNRATLRSLEPLQPTPVLVDGRPLETAIRSLHAAASAQTAAQSRRDALEPLQPPPAIGDEVTLERSITVLRREANHARQKQAAIVALRGLRETPTLPTPDEMQQHLTRLQQQTREVTRRTSAIGEIDTQLLAARAELEAFIHRNPTCPTCGGTLEAERILAGGHAHE